jgi:hypothetical protein
MQSMKEKYGEKKGESVFYATANKQKQDAFNADGYVGDREDFKEAEHKRDEGGKFSEGGGGGKVDHFAEKVSGQKGSNPGGIYKGSDGKERYIKFYKNPEQGRQEATANDIYNDLGIGAPKSDIVDGPGGKEAFASELIKGGETLEHQGLTKENCQEVLKGFAADVLLANWDAVGLTHDNILMKDGKAHRIDNGSAFTFRAQGTPKPEHLLEQATEWDVFSSSKNREYNKVFQKAGYKSAADIPDIKQQVQRIVELQRKSGGWDKYISERAPYLSDKERGTVAKMLTKRTEQLAQKTGVAKDAVRPVALDYEGPLPSSRIGKTMADVVPAPPPKGLYIEFEKKPGQYFKLAAKSDTAIDNAVKQAGLWKKGADYPYFSIYQNGEETSSGGGEKFAMDGEPKMHALEEPLINCPVEPVSVHDAGSPADDPEIQKLTQQMEGFKNKRSPEFIRLEDRRTALVRAWYTKHGKDAVQPVPVKDASREELHQFQAKLKSPDTCRLCGGSKSLPAHQVQPVKDAYTCPSCGAVSSTSKSRCSKCGYERDQAEDTPPRSDPNAVFDAVRPVSVRDAYDPRMTNVKLNLQQQKVQWSPQIESVVQEALSSGMTVPEIVKEVIAELGSQSGRDAPIPLDMEKSEHRSKALQLMRQSKDQGAYEEGQKVYVDPQHVPQGQSNVAKVMEQVPSASGWYWLVKVGGRNVIMDDTQFQADPFPEGTDGEQATERFVSDFLKGRERPGEARGGVAGLKGSPGPGSEDDYEEEGYEHHAAKPKSSQKPWEDVRPIKDIDTRYSFPAQKLETQADGLARSGDYQKAAQLYQQACKLYEQADAPAYVQHCQRMVQHCQNEMKGDAKDVEGYTDSGGTFHPISGTKGYSRKKAGGVGRGAPRKRSRDALEVMPV